MRQVNDYNLWLYDKHVPRQSAFRHSNKWSDKSGCWSFLPKRKPLFLRGTWAVARLSLRSFLSIYFEKIDQTHFFVSGFRKQRHSLCVGNEAEWHDTQIGREICSPRRRRDTPASLTFPRASRRF